MTSLAIEGETRSYISRESRGLRYVRLDSKVPNGDDDTAALHTCRCFKDHIDHIGHDSYYPLYAAIVVCYG